jgi:hypothetical protein
MLTVFLLCRACKPVLTCMQSSAAAALSTWCSIVLRVVTLANSKVEHLLLLFSFLFFAWVCTCRPGRGLMVRLPPSCMAPQIQRQAFDATWLRRYVFWRRDDGAAASSPLLLLVITSSRLATRAHIYARANRNMLWFSVCDPSISSILNHTLSPFHFHCASSIIIID